MRRRVDKFSSGGTGTNATVFNTTFFQNTTSDIATFINITAGATFLLVGVEFNQGGGTGGTLALTWDQGGTNQSMTSLGSPVLNSNVGDAIQYFGLVNPTSGNKTLRVTNSGNTFGNLGAEIWGMSFNGTATASVAAATEGYATNTDGGTAGTALTVSSAVSIPSGDMAVTQWIDTTSMTTFPTDSGTLGDNTFSGFYVYEYYNGAGSVINSSATLATSGFWTGMIVGIKAAGAAATCPMTRSLMGVGC